MAPRPRSKITNAAVNDQVPRGETAGGRDTVPNKTPFGSAVNRPSPVPSEFQKFVLESTGKSLPVFGAEYFANSPSTFAPVTNTPVPADYPMGPGDEVLIRGWGSIDIDYRAVIDRNGMITIPTVGSIVLGGVKAGDVEAVVRGAVGRLYKGVTLNVTFGQLRAITVYVVGQANRPGTYTVSNMATLVTALFASGGPNANGSMRRVQVKRGGKIAAELDLYSFIARGDKSSDIKLQDGDTIYIPAASGYVAIVGKINNSAIYELRSANDTIESLIDYAGGLPVVADPRRVFLERIDPKANKPRSVEQFALDGAGLKRAMKDGDILNITSITPDFLNAVVLRGNVDQPVRAPFKPGMRISDLIPSREYLISRSSTQRQNAAVIAGSNDKVSGESASGEKNSGENANSIASRIGGLMDEINWEYAVVERLNRTDLTVNLIPFNLGQIFSDPANPQNIVLQPGDTVTIFSQKDVAVPLDKRRVFVRVEGEVNAPGVYQMSPGEDLQSLLARAGGPTRNAYLFGTAFYREQVRIDQQANLDKVIDRLETQLRLDQAKAALEVRGQTESEVQLSRLRREAELASARETIQRMRKLAATGRIAFGLDPAERSFNRLPQLKLENGDRLVVAFRPEFVHIMGAVNAEASAVWRPGRRVSDYLDKVGLRQEADTDAMFVIRVDGSVIGGESRSWFAGKFTNTEVYPGDTIVVPEKSFAKESLWSQFTTGAKEWTQILANFGLAAAALQVLKK
ncbi:polysaccharide export protein [Duganella ginsengisoli]|uniref:Polysaccharide export protein n=2 Tax=Pseudoduganella ginsengisoli TaxID=1462440 RepID=A0A6L6PV45_9BURK|nr:polysaccharide export protein [Pseudoduganella ginsengisoli]